LIIDLHTHSFPRSDDSFVGPDELIEKAKSIGLDAICFTEHDYFWDVDSLRGLSARHDFLVLSGSEINTDSGHVLAFGLTEYRFGMHKVHVLDDLTRQAGGALIAAHPYRRRFLPEHAHKPDYYQSMIDDARADPIFRVCDAVEGLNGRATEGETKFSLDLSDHLEMRTVGGSDAHRLHTLGAAATEFHRRVDSVETLVQEIKTGRFHHVALVEDPAAQPKRG
jgi:predicted metal-dependent phosphoesterase TrpH